MFPGRGELQIGWNDYAVTGLTLERSGAEISRSTPGRAFNARFSLNEPTPSTLNLRLRATLAEAGVSLLRDVEIPANALAHSAPWTGGLPLAGNWTVMAVDNPPPAFSGAIAGADEMTAAVAASARNLRIVPQEASSELVLELTGSDDLILEEGGSAANLRMQLSGSVAVITLTLLETDNDGSLDAVIEGSGMNTEVTYTPSFPDQSWFPAIRALQDDIPEPPETVIVTATAPGTPRAVLIALITDDDDYVPPPGGPFVIAIEAAKNRISEKELAAGSHRTTVSVSVRGLEEGRTLDVELKSADNYGVGDGDGEPDLLFWGDDGALGPTLTVTVTGGRGPAAVQVRARDDGIVETREDVLVWGTAPEATAAPDIVEIGWNDYALTALTLTDAGGGGIAAINPGEPFNVNLEFNAALPTWITKITVRATLRGTGIFSEMNDVFVSQAAVRKTFAWDGDPLTAPGIWEVAAPPPLQFLLGFFAPFLDESTAATTAAPQTLIVRGLRLIVEAQDDAIAESAGVGNNATTLNVSVLNTLLPSDPQVRVRLTLAPEHAGDLSFAADAVMSTKELTVTAGAEPAPVRVWALDDDLPEPRETVTIEATGEALGEAAGTEVFPGRGELQIGWNDYALTGLTLVDADGDRITTIDTGEPFNMKLEFNDELPTTLLVTVRATPRGSGPVLRIEAEAGPTAAQLMIPWPRRDAPLAPGVWDVEATPPSRFPAGSFTPFVDESTAAVTAAAQTLAVQELRVAVEAQDEAIAEGAHTGSNATTLNVSVASTLPNLEVRVLLAVAPEHAGDLSFAADAVMSTKELTVAVNAEPVPAPVWALDDGLPEPREIVTIEALGEALGEASGTAVVSGREELRIGWSDYALTGLILERAGTEISRSMQGRPFDVRLAFNAPTPSTLNLRLRATLPGPGTSELSLPQDVEIASNSSAHLAPWAGGLPLAGDWTAAAFADPPPAFSGAIAGVDEPAVVAAPTRSLNIVPDDGAPTAPFLELEATGERVLVFREGERTSLSLRAVGVPLDLIPTEMTLTLFDTDNDGAPDAVFAPPGGSAVRSFPVASVPSGLTRWSAEISALDDDLPEPPEEAVAMLTLPGAPSVAVRMLIIDNDGYAPPPGEPLVIAVEAAKRAISEKELAEPGSHRTTVTVSVRGLEADRTLDVELTAFADVYGVGDGDSEPDLLFEDADGALTPTLTVTVTGGRGPVTVWAQARDDDIVEDREQALVWGGAAEAPEALTEPALVEIGWNDYEITALTPLGAFRDRIAAIAIDPGERFFVKLEFNASLPTWLLDILVRARLRGTGVVSDMQISAQPTVVEQVDQWRGLPLTAPGIWDLEVVPDILQRFLYFRSGDARVSEVFVDEETAAVKAASQTLIVRGLRVAVEAQDEAIAEEAQTGNNATTLNISVVDTLSSADAQVRVRLAVDPEHAGDLSFAADAVRSTLELTVTANAEPVPVRVWALDDDLPEPRETVTIEATGEALGEASATAVFPDREEALIGWNDYALTGLRLERAGTEISQSTPDRDFGMRLRLNAPTPSTLNLRLRMTLAELGVSLLQDVEIARNSSEHLALWASGLPFTGDWTAAAVADPPPAFNDAVPDIDESAAVTASTRNLKIVAPDGEQPLQGLMIDVTVAASPRNPSDAFDVRLLLSAPAPGDSAVQATVQASLQGASAAVRTATVRIGPGQTGGIETIYMTRAGTWTLSVSEVKLVADGTVLDVTAPEFAVRALALLDYDGASGGEGTRPEQIRAFVEYFQANPLATVAADCTEAARTAPNPAGRLPCLDVTGPGFAKDGVTDAEDIAVIRAYMGNWHYIWSELFPPRFFLRFIEGYEAKYKDAAEEQVMELIRNVQALYPRTPVVCRHFSRLDCGDE